MEHIGIDVHKNQSQICILTPEGEILEQRILTERERFAAVLGSRPRCRILIESSTESEWVARCLEGLGHEVIVADPNFAPMYAQRTRRIKTDRRDARALAEACRLGAYRPAHRASEARRHLRGQLAVREALVRTRVRYISLIRALLRGQGVRVRSGSARCFLARLNDGELPETLRQMIGPLVAVMEGLNEQIGRADEEVETVAREDAEVERLCSAPGVGPVTAASFVATVDRAERFRGAHAVQAYVGLVPREMSSGEKQHKGRITKQGHGRTRWLLVEAAWVILHRTRDSDAEPLREWAKRIALRRGQRVAVVALARKLAGILFAMMRDGTRFDPGQWAKQIEPVAMTE